MLSFIPPRTDVTTSAETKEETILQVAGILKLAANPALRRIVEEYIDDPLLSLLGEADAAREYIDDSRRNRKGQRMTPSFFRRWLKREHEDALQRRARSMQVTGTADQNGGKGSPTGGFHAKEGFRPSSPHPSTPTTPSRNLMNLREEYAAEMYESVKQRATTIGKED